MRLTLFTDYALRLLVYLAGAGPGYRTTIGEAAAALDIPLNHLTKIVNRLAKVGLLKSSRGRSGGLSLGRPPTDVTIGEIIRVTEPDFDLVACMSGHDCSLAGQCNLVPVLGSALGAFLSVMDKTVLADLVTGEGATSGVLVSNGKVDPRSTGDACK